MPANKRDKASDVFNSTNYAFCSKVSFSEAFPQIKNIRAEVEEDGEGVYGLSCKIKICQWTSTNHDGFSKYRALSLQDSLMHPLYAESFD
ncbi:MAG: hypothetical protein VR72_21305 [Clostridiaceae bacterium BRH_c20a]|nr:MAG: hypothetical protein VR72_21305 [Clostridiaceae bacterium BRH_c20a]